MYPWYSENVFNELTITNLSLCYERALDDLSEIKRLFGINHRNQSVVLYGKKLGADGKEIMLFKDDESYPIREAFLESCYNSKIT